MSSFEHPEQPIDSQLVDRARAYCDAQNRVEDFQRQRTLALEAEKLAVCDQLDAYNDLRAADLISGRRSMGFTGMENTSQEPCEATDQQTAVACLEYERYRAARKRLDVLVERADRELAEARSVLLDTASSVSAVVDNLESEIDIDELPDLAVGNAKSEILGVPVLLGKSECKMGTAAV